MGVWGVLGAEGAGLRKVKGQPSARVVLGAECRGAGGTGVLGAGGLGVQRAAGAGCRGAGSAAVVGAGMVSVQAVGVPGVQGVLGVLGGGVAGHRGPEVHGAGVQGAVVLGLQKSWGTEGAGCVGVISAGELGVQGAEC